MHQLALQRSVILSGTLTIYLIFPHTLALFELIMSTSLRLQASLPVLSTGDIVIGSSAQGLVLEVHAYSIVLLQLKKPNTLIKSEKKKQANKNSPPKKQKKKYWTLNTYFWNIDDYYLVLSYFSVSIKWSKLCLDHDPELYLLRVNLSFLCKVSGDKKHKILF